MKNFYFFLFIVFSSCLKEKEAQVRNISTNIDFRINDIYFINTTTGFAVGGSRYDEGYILKTNDGGNTWKKIDSLQIHNKKNIHLQTLNSIDFLNEKVGEVVGHGGKILRTEDGGENWDITLNGSWENFNKVALFENNKTILLSSNGFSNGTIFKSEENWYEFKTEKFDFAVRDIEFTDSLTAYLACYGYIKKTIDGGQTWSYLNIEGDYFFDIDFITNKIGYVCGWEGSIYKTSNSGETWKNIHNKNQAFSSRHHYENIDFIDENIGVVCGYLGEVLYTNDGGKTWKKILTNTKTNFHSIFLYNRNKIFVGGENGEFLEITI